MPRTRQEDSFILHIHMSMPELNKARCHVPEDRPRLLIYIENTLRSRLSGRVRVRPAGPGHHHTNTARLLENVRGDGEAGPPCAGASNSIRDALPPPLDGVGRRQEPEPGGRSISLGRLHNPKSLAKDCFFICSPRLACTSTWPELS